MTWPGVEPKSPGPWEDIVVHTFPKSIYPKVNVIARLEYELAYYDSSAHCFNHYTTRTPPCYHKAYYKIYMFILNAFEIYHLKKMVSY